MVYLRAIALFAGTLLGMYTIGATTAHTAYAETSMPPAIAAKTEQPSSKAPANYSNPVTRGVVDTFPDPSMIRGKDGSWYAYGTTNPIFHSKGKKSEHILPILRSNDMVHWSYVGDVFSRGNAPNYWPAKARAWAPDIHYLNGHYVLTYALSSGGIALASSQQPAGPWTDKGLIVPAKNTGCPTGTIDQSLFTDTDGTHYLYWGSYDTICGAKMNADATALSGPVKPLVRGHRAEGSFVVHRDGYYYLFYSVGGCCDGVFSGYTVKVGRARSPLGPFVTQDGQRLTELRSKGGIVASANGNRWVGPGHNAIQTDLAGQDWLVYHAIPENDPDFPPVEGARGGTLAALAKRPLLIDRLNWIDGWPIVRAGAGPSAGPQPVPVTTALAGSRFNHGLAHGWKASGAPAGHWSLAHSPDALGILAQTDSPASPSYFLNPRRVKGNLRVEGDMKLVGYGSGGAVGLVVYDQGNKGRIVAWIDRGAHALVVAVTRTGKTARTRARLPKRFDYGSWHNLAVEIRGTHLRAQVASDRLREPLASVSMRFAARSGAGRVGAASRGAPARADNISAAHLYTPVAKRVPTPQPGEPLSKYSDDFNHRGRPNQADSSWHWRREDTSVTEHGGMLNWPSHAGELHDHTNTAPVLLRDAPRGDFMVETKLDFNAKKVGQKAGLLLYETDNRYLELTHSILKLNHLKNDVFHVVEFDKEGRRSHTVPPQPVFNAPMYGGPPAPTTWLRLACHYDTHRRQYIVRMASSTDGMHWIWGGTWSLPAKSPLRIGLVATHTSSGTTARFDYVHTYRYTPLRTRAPDSSR